MQNNTNFLTKFFFSFCNTWNISFYLYFHLKYWNSCCILLQNASSQSWWWLINKTPIYYLILCIRPGVPAWFKWKLKSLSRVWLFATPWTYNPWNSPGQNTGVGSLSLLQGIFPTQGLNPGLPHCRHFFTSWAPREAQHDLKGVLKVMTRPRLFLKLRIPF